MIEGICGGFGSVSEMGWFLGLLNRLCSEIVELSPTKTGMVVQEQRERERDLELGNLKYVL